MWRVGLAWDCSVLWPSVLKWHWSQVSQKTYLCCLWDSCQTAVDTQLSNSSPLSFAFKLLFWISVLLWQYDLSTLPLEDQRPFSPKTRHVPRIPLTRKLSFTICQKEVEAEENFSLSVEKTVFHFKLLSLKLHDCLVCCLCFFFLSMFHKLFFPLVSAKYSFSLILPGRTILTCRYTAGKSTHCVFLYPRVPLFVLFHFFPVFPSAYLHNEIFFF